MRTLASHPASQFMPPSQTSISPDASGAALDAATGRRFTPARAALWLSILAVALIATLLASLAVGSSGVPLSDLLVAGAPSESVAILWQVRLPRVLLAAAVGACLAAAGACFQSLLRNPLADPYILGISGGAGLGAIISGLLAPAAGLAVLMLRPTAAFIGSLAAVSLLLALTRGTGRMLPETMILMGVVINATIMAAIMFIITVADFSRYQGTMYWLMGNLSSPTWPELALVFGCLVPGAAALSLMGGTLNVLSGGEELASQLGVNVPRARLAVLCAASLITAAAVSLAGLVGFVGLMIPHMGRLWLGPDNRLLVPASALLGAIALVTADTLARALFAPTQIPVGVITALGGGPCFLWMFARSRRRDLGQGS